MTYSRKFFFQRTHAKPTLADICDPVMLESTASGSGYRSLYLDFGSSNVAKYARASRFDYDLQPNLNSRPRMNFDYTGGSASNSNRGETRDIPRPSQRYDRMSSRFQSSRTESVGYTPVPVTPPAPPALARVSKGEAPVKEPKREILNRPSDGFAADEGREAPDKLNLPVAVPESAPPRKHQFEPQATEKVEPVEKSEVFNPGKRSETFARRDAEEVGDIQVQVSGMDNSEMLGSLDEEKAESEEAQVAELVPKQEDPHKFDGSEEDSARPEIASSSEHSTDGDKADESEPVLPDDVHAGAHVVEEEEEEERRVAEKAIVSTGNKASAEDAVVAKQNVLEKPMPVSRTPIITAAEVLEPISDGEEEDEEEFDLSDFEALEKLIMEEEDSEGSNTDDDFQREGGIARPNSFPDSKGLESTRKTPQPSKMLQQLLKGSPKTNKGPTQQEQTRAMASGSLEQPVREQASDSSNSSGSGVPPINSIEEESQPEP